MVPVLSKHFDVPQVLDADGVILYPTGSSSTVARVSLLVPMYPNFGEPVSLCVNHRNTDLNALRHESNIKVMEKDKYLIKKACILKKIYEHKSSITWVLPRERSSTLRWRDSKNKSKHSIIYGFVTSSSLQNFYKHG